MSLRLGVLCAVIDDRGQVLLSRRGDLNVWALPGGRLDSGERFEEAAAREVYEETGVEIEVEQPVSLVYYAGWRRLNIVFRARPAGGELRAQTGETRDNRYFPHDALPPMPLGAIVRDALQPHNRPLNYRVINPGVLRQTSLRLRLGWRWFQNRLRGRPEPKFPAFLVRAVALILDPSLRRVVTLPGMGNDPIDSAHGYRGLPRVLCTGDAAPWGEVAREMAAPNTGQLTFRWIGLWQDAHRFQIELVFAALMPEGDLRERAGADWSNLRNTAFSDRDQAYVERIKPSLSTESVWSLSSNSSRVDVITRKPTNDPR